MAKFNAGGSVVASTYIGEIEAETAEEAIQKAWGEAQVSVCHACSKHISDPEVEGVWVEDEEGNFTDEGGPKETYDAMVKNHVKEVKLLKAKNKRLREVLKQSFKAMQENINYAAYKDERVLADAMYAIRNVLKGRV